MTRGDELRVLQVVTDTDRRGAQVFGAELHAALEPLVHHVKTVALADGRVGGLRLDVLGSDQRSVSTGLALRTRARDADVVIAHGSTTQPMCALWLAGTGVPFVYRQISDPLASASDPLRRLRVRGAYRRAAHVVALWPGSAAVLKEHFGVRDERISVIPNGIPRGRIRRSTPERRREARERFGVPLGDPLALFVGALSPEKGPDLALDVVPRIEGLHLLIVGDGPERSSLEDRSGTLAPGRIVFTGSLDDVEPAYAAADVVIVPSRSESMPGVIIEAAFAGVPSVAAAVGAVPSMLADGRGLIFPAGDVAELTRCVGLAIQDERRSADMAEKARRYALQRWEIGRIARAWVDTLERVTQRKPS